MSNELATLLSNNPALAGLDEDTLAVAGGGGKGGIKRISIKGGVFRKYAGGKEIGAIEDRHMNVIIVKMAHKATKKARRLARLVGQAIQTYLTLKLRPLSLVRATTASTALKVRAITVWVQSVSCHGALLLYCLTIQAVT